jgi:hypothetical protein
MNENFHGSSKRGELWVISPSFASLGYRHDPRGKCIDWTKWFWVYQKRPIKLPQWLFMRTSFRDQLTNWWWEEERYVINFGSPNMCKNLKSRVYIYAPWFHFVIFRLIKIIGGGGVSNIHGNVRCLRSLSRKTKCRTCCDAEPVFCRLQKLVTSCNKQGAPETAPYQHNPRVLEVNFKNIYSGVYMKKERVGHSFLGKIEFGSIYMFLERTDAIVYLHQSLTQSCRSFQSSQTL